MRFSNGAMVSKLRTPRSNHRSVSLAGTLSLLTLITCGDQIDNFTITEEASTTVSRASVLESLAEVLLGDLGFGNFLNIDLVQNETLANQGVERHQIDSVKIDSLILEITEPASGQDFEFLEEIEFFVQADGLESRRIASGGPFASGLERVGLNVDDVELAPYVTADSMDITTRVTGRRPQRETTIKGTMELGVDVSLTGVLCGE